MAGLLVACILAGLVGRFLRSHGCLALIAAFLVLPVAAIMIDGGAGLSGAAIVIYAGLAAYAWPRIWAWIDRWR